MRNRRTIALCALALLVQTAVAQGVFERTDTQKEIELGREVYDQVKASGLLSKNEAYIRRVNRVFDQLMSALPQKLYPFQVIVVANNSVNANCLPGGYVTVYEGLLAKMPEDNELAFVLAHEVGHGTRRHWVRETRKMQSEVASQVLVSALFGTPYNENGTTLAHFRFKREHETEADAFGVELYLRAGFDPAAVSNGMRVLADMDKGQEHVPEYLSTHPDSAKRVLTIEKTRDQLLSSGLRPFEVDTPNLTVEQVFGKIPTVAPLPCQWMATEPGTTWKYEVENKAGGSSAYMVRAVGVAQVDSSPIVRMELQMGGQSIPYQMIGDSDRVWRRNRPNDPKSPWTLEFVVPEEGTSEGDDRKAFIGLAKERVTTPAGTFENCMKVESREPGRSLTLWYAPGVGLVKRENASTGVSERLVAFSRP